jgi:hypothetical protein
MKTSYLIQIHKKGGKRNENYKGINIADTFIKILGSIFKTGQKHVIREMRNKVVSLNDDQL